MTYRELFERYLTQSVEPSMARFIRSPDGFRPVLFDDFVGLNMFVCAACGTEFEPAGVAEGDVVRCGRCS